MEQQKLLTEGELLVALNIQADRTAVWRWRQQGMPHVKIGRSNRYELGAVQRWLHERSAATGQWDWSVWTWVPESRQPSGEIEPAFWYEECRCRNQTDAENIVKLFQTVQPAVPIQASTSKPGKAPDAVLR